MDAIRTASTAADYASFAQLIAEYVAWLHERYRGDTSPIGEVLAHQSFDDELRELPTIYGPPNGRAFLAMHDGEPCGCGAWRRLDGTTCEMKRVFVPDRHRGYGIGRRLCAAIVAAARDEGYATMRLDTGLAMTEAHALYRSMGFVECAPYIDYPPHLLPSFVFMELGLADA